ncbi:unnamed protein product [Tetraodon nigroviridis]|uniref:(spotted green pufferfish) hypothetical protein n=1 Tax=Tetraodon nigroviridis TaxID=99883 RepID=Q4S3H8_TETNG|nr:unnamed protein product [Tetraodon nigroviridis]
MPGGRRVFRLESVLEAGVDELYDILFLRVEEMHKWNPSIQQIKVSCPPKSPEQAETHTSADIHSSVPAFGVSPQVLKHVGSETIVTHEVSAQTAGNLIGQRDFVCVRHSRKYKSDLYLSGEAIQLESFPPLAGFVRAEDGPSCILLHALGAKITHFTWLLNMDVKRLGLKCCLDCALLRRLLESLLRAAGAPEVEVAPGLCLASQRSGRIRRWDPGMEQHQRAARPPPPQQRWW